MVFKNGKVSRKGSKIKQNKKNEKKGFKTPTAKFSRGESILRVLGVQLDREGGTGLKVSPHRYILLYKHHSIYYEQPEMVIYTMKSRKCIYKKKEGY